MVSVKVTDFKGNDDKKIKDLVAKNGCEIDYSKDGTNETITNVTIKGPSNTAILNAMNALAAAFDQKLNATSKVSTL